MKTRNLYHVRVEIDNGYSTRIVGYKMRLVSRTRALKIVRFLKNRGRNAFFAPVKITCA